MVDRDRQQLKLLSIFHYVFGGLTIVIGNFSILHLLLGISFLREGGIQVDGAANPFPTESIAWMFIVIPSISIAINWSLAILSIISGIKIAERKNYAYCFFVACVECIFMPLGTALGVFTIIVLLRESVKELFGRSVS